MLSEKHQSAQVTYYVIPYILYFEMSILQKWTDKWLLGVKDAGLGRGGRHRRRVETAGQENSECHHTGNLCGDETVPYLDCININILVVIFGSCFTRYFHLGNLHKNWDIFILFVTTVCKSIIISKSKLKEKKRHKLKVKSRINFFKIYELQF